MSHAKHDLSTVHNLSLKLYHAINNSIFFLLPVALPIISETSLSRQSTALVLTTRNKETKHCIHQKHRRETEKNILDDKTNCTLVLYAFYDLHWVQTSKDAHNQI